MFNTSIIGMFMYKEVMSNNTIIFNINISDVVGNHGRILGIVIFFNISFKNVSYVFVKILQWDVTS